MPDTAIGFVLLGVGILVVLGVVFAVSSRGGGRARPRESRPVACTCPGQATCRS